MCGIGIAKKSSKNHPINVKNASVSILNCVSATSITILINEANTFDEYTDILFRSVSMATCGILYEIFVWKTTNLVEFINSFEDIIKASKFD